MRTAFDGAGHLVNDNRGSGGALVETDVLGCKHCQAVIASNRFAQNFARCGNCDGPICLPCAIRMRTLGCENFKRQVDSALLDAHRKAQNLRCMGV